MMLSLLCRRALLGLLVCLSSFAFAEPSAVETSHSVSLKELKADEHPAIQEILHHGEEPQIIYVPIHHDGPYHHLSNVPMEEMEQILAQCEQIASLLYDDYALRHVLLEGISAPVAEYYNRLEDGRKISFKSNMKTWQTWKNILNSRDWQAVPESEKQIAGPLQRLGREYSQRIIQAMDEAKAKGWFRSRENYEQHQEEFQGLMEAACRGYNEGVDKILETDPKLLNEYAKVVTERNRSMLEHARATQSPVILFLGSAHTHDLIEQLQELDMDYTILVPKGVTWPVQPKNEEEIFEDMLKMGCQLKRVTLGFGEGGSTKLTLPLR